MRWRTILGLALPAVLASSGVVLGTASAQAHVLELYETHYGASPPTLVGPGTELEVYSGSEEVQFVGTSTLKCNEEHSDDYYLLAGSDVTNSEPKDEITITSIRIPACGSERVGVSGPATLTLTAKGDASLTGAMIFGFPDGCAYETKKLTGTTSPGGYGYVALAGAIKRTHSSPGTCEPGLFVDGIAGYLETFFQPVSEVVS